MTIEELKAQLANVEEKISEILTTGQSVSVSGSFSVTNPTLAELRKQEALLRKRIFRCCGYTGRLIPDFSSGGNNDVKNENE